MAVAAQEAVEAKAEAMASQVRRMAEEGAALRAELAQVRAAATAQAEARASAEVRAEAAVAHTEMIEAHAAEPAAQPSIPAVWMPPACITPPRLTWEGTQRAPPCNTLRLDSESDSARLDLTRLHLTRLHLIRLHLTRLHLTRLHLTRLHLTRLDGHQTGISSS